jgi:hypothetical protein
MSTVLSLLSKHGAMFSLFLQENWFGEMLDRLDMGTFFSFDLLYPEISDIVSESL